MRDIVIAGALGVIVAVVAALGLVSSQAPDDLTETPSILTVYDQR